MKKIKKKTKKKRPKINLIKEKIKNLKYEIRCHQENIELLLDFATGKKRSKNPRLKNYQRTKYDDFQLLETVTCLRTQIRRKEQELAVLMGVNTDAV